MRSKLKTALTFAEVAFSLVAIPVAFAAIGPAIVLLTIAGSIASIRNAIDLGNLGVRVAEGLGDLDVRVTTLESGGFDVVKKD